jgi:hypothetical protein
LGCSLDGTPTGLDNGDRLVEGRDRAERRRGSLSGRIKVDTPAAVSAVGSQTRPSFWAEEHYEMALIDIHHHLIGH